MICLAPLIIISNTFLFLCMVGLFAVAIRQGHDWKNTTAVGDASHRIVANYLADRVPNHEYRVRHWFPPKPLSGNQAGQACRWWARAAEKGFTQRVRLELYEANGPLELDMVCWVADGKVTKCVQADQARLLNDSLQR